VARVPSEEPQSLVYRPELISADEEAELLARLETLRYSITFRALRRGG
jgi:hypothetical protein